MSSPGHRWRFLFGCLLAGAVLSAHAVDFDEKLQAPSVAVPAAFKAQALSFKAKVEALRDAAPQELIANRALAAEQFELGWKLQRAVDARRSAELVELGFTEREDGSFAINYSEHPEWHRVDQSLSGWLPVAHWPALSADLMARGFRDADLAAVKTYIDNNDPKLATARSVLPVSLAFSKVVKKLDKLKRPVPDSLVMSYVYQRARAAAEANRQWANGLLQTLDAQRVRILLSYMGEMQYFGVIAPDDQTAGIADVLKAVRLPDYEKLATAEAAGGTP